MKSQSYHRILVAGAITAAFLTSYVDTAASHLRPSQDGAIMKSSHNLIDQQYGEEIQRFFTALQIAHKISPATASSATVLNNALQAGNHHPIDESRSLFDEISTDSLLPINDKLLIISFVEKTLTLYQDIMWRTQQAMILSAAPENAAY